MHLHESEWINQNNPEVPVTRAMLMIALQVGLLIVLKNNNDEISHFEMLCGCFRGRCEYFLRVCLKSNLDFLGMEK